MKKFISSLAEATTAAASTAVTAAVTTAVTAAVTAATTAAINRVADGFKSRQAEVAAEKIQFLGRSNAVATVNGSGIAYIAEYTGAGQNPASSIQGFGFALIIGDSITDSSVTMMKPVITKNWKVVERLPIQEARIMLARLEEEFIKNPPKETPVKAETTTAPVEVPAVTKAPTTKAPKSSDAFEKRLKDLECAQNLKLSALKALNRR